jgi:hypothetical protein
VVVVDGRVGHALLGLGIGALELVDPLLDSAWHGASVTTAWATAGSVTSLGGGALELPRYLMFAIIALLL